MTFICKADSDTWLVLPDIAHHLESVVAHDTTHAGAYAYYGAIGFFSLVDVDATPDRPAQYVHRGFSPWFDMGLRLLRQYVMPDCVGRHNASGPSSNASERCAGPFPYAYGPFIALGRLAAAALISQPAFNEEISRLPDLIRSASNASAGSASQGASAPPSHVATEDVWLGSALWRFVGSDAPLQLYSLSSEQSHLYQDANGLTIRPTLSMWHNRNKQLGRMKLLSLHWQQAHCPARALRWARSTRICCGKPKHHVASAAAFTRGKAVGKRRGSDADGARWPLHLVDPAYRRGQGGACGRAVDLASEAALWRLGLAERLRPVSYVRSEPNASWAHLYLWQKEIGE